MESTKTSRDVKGRVTRIIVALGALNVQLASNASFASANEPSDVTKQMVKASEQFAQSAGTDAFNLAAFQDSFPDAWDDGIGSFTKWLDDVPPDWNDHVTVCNNWENGDASC